MYIYNIQKIIIKLKHITMKRHQFYFEPFPQTCLLGISIGQFETQWEDEDKWYPTFRVELGFIFFTLSYTKISIS